MTDVPRLVLSGEPISVVYESNPRIGRGQFRAVNQTPEPIYVSVINVRVKLGDREFEPTHLSIIDLDTDATMDPAGFSIPGSSTLRFLLGFPAIAVEPMSWASNAVSLTLGAGGEGMEAKSEINFEKRVLR